MPVKSRRSRIPSNIASQVLIASGHRCAVCGESCTIDRAHIIPWSKIKEHKVENLICLCPNCHRKAHSENWSQNTLKAYKQNPWILRRGNAIQAPRIAGLNLSVDLLGGSAEITGCSQNGVSCNSSWQFWLELYLVPSEHIPATIPIHRITGSLEINGLNSGGLDNVSLETTYQTPPDILNMLYGRSNKPKQIVINNPIPVLLVAFCQTPEWKLTDLPQDVRIYVNFEIAEDDYQKLEIVAQLKHLDYAGSTMWRVDQNLKA